MPSSTNWQMENSLQPRWHAYSSSSWGGTREDLHSFLHSRINRPKKKKKPKPHNFFFTSATKKAPSRALQSFPPPDLEVRETRQSGSSGIKHSHSSVTLWCSLIHLRALSPGVSQTWNSKFRSAIQFLQVTAKPRCTCEKAQALKIRGNIAKDLLTLTTERVHRHPPQNFNRAQWVKIKTDFVVFFCRLFFTLCYNVPTSL